MLVHRAAVGLDERAGGAGKTAPVPERVADHLRSVVAPHEAWCHAAPQGDSVKAADDVIGAESAVDVECEQFSGVLVEHREPLEGPPVGGLVKAEVDRPHLVRARSRASLRIDARPSQSAGLACLLRALQALLSPQTVHTLVVHLDAFQSQ